MFQRDLFFISEIFYGIGYMPRPSQQIRSNLHSPYVNYVNLCLSNKEQKRLPSSTVAIKS